MLAQIQNSMSCRLRKSDSSNNEWKYDKFTSIHCVVGNALCHYYYSYPLPWPLHTIPMCAPKHCVKMNWMDSNEETDKLNRKWRVIETHTQCPISEIANERNCSTLTVHWNFSTCTKKHIFGLFIHCHTTMDSLPLNFWPPCILHTTHGIAFISISSSLAHAHETIIISFSLQFDHMHVI